MKALAVGFALAAMLGAANVAHAQNTNYPFLNPPNGAQVQVPSGWPPRSGDGARPPAYTRPFTPPGTFAPFQGGDRGNDRGVVGEPETTTSPLLPGEATDPLIGTPGRAVTRKPSPGQGDDKNAPDAGQDTRSQANIARPRTMPQEDAIPKVVRLPKDARERASVLYDLFSRSREVKPPKQSDRKVAVGSRLPPSWVYMDVPEAITRALPSYVGYVYTNVDGRFVVVDPATYKAVAVYGEVPS